MSLYADYVKLEERYDIIETDHGFVTYQLCDKELFVSDCYVRPTSPNGEWNRVWDSLKDKAKEVGCTHLSCIVYLDPTRVDYTTRKMKTFLGHGFKVVSSQVNKIVLLREV